ncbi:zinc-binding dehydrogenase [Maribellus comscasis]|uniref:Zinc-binding dehydrogenase n=1 Tax=Maribellus comscasis TaxID=2681766 RepID=A0A6I6JYH2_9BACT|nr:NAD(P)-dependent alcohol dehydrogenase [Maribellus comscasis]QGY48055.1 zinc-binding dehydrogenase [Maribellus comscasis]
MKAVIYNKKGAEKLVYTDVEKPVPRENEVLIKVIASSVNAADYRSMRLGIVPKRKIFGADVAGRIESVGKGVSHWKTGDEVMGDLSGSGFGCFAEYTLAPENKVIQKPAELSFAEAAAIPLAAMTAIQAMRNKGKIQKGHKVLIVGSGGGVGTFAVQLARHFGAEITAVCSTRNAEQSKMLGAQTVIDYTKEDFTRTRQRFDLILAVNGNEALLTYRRLLEPGGRYLMVGGAMTQILKSLLFGKLLSLGKKKMLAVSAKANMADLEFIATRVAKGQIRPVIDRTYTLEQTPEAMEYANTGHAQGKVLIKVE